MTGRLNGEMRRWSGQCLMPQHDLYGAAEVESQQKRQRGYEKFSALRARTGR